MKLQHPEKDVKKEAIKLLKNALKRYTYREISEVMEVALKTVWTWKNEGKISIKNARKVIDKLS